MTTDQLENKIDLLLDACEKKLYNFVENERIQIIDLFNQAKIVFRIDSENPQIIDKIYDQNYNNEHIDKAIKDVEKSTKIFKNNIKKLFKLLLAERKNQELIFLSKADSDIRDIVLSKNITSDVIDEQNNSESVIQRRKTLLDSIKTTRYSSMSNANESWNRIVGEIDHKFLSPFWVHNRDKRNGYIDKKWSLIIETNYKRFTEYGNIILADGWSHWWLPYDVYTQEWKLVACHVGEILRVWKNEFYVELWPWNRNEHDYFPKTPQDLIEECYWEKITIHFVRNIDYKLEDQRYIETEVTTSS